MNAPETAAQAKRWDRLKREALDFGLCDRCAGQSAWARQLGATVMESSPCEPCRALLLSIGGALGERVQRWAEKPLSGDLRYAPRLRGVKTPAEAETALVGAL